MKKIYSILMILAAAAGFTNCSKADLVENKEAGNGGTVVYATTDAVTKTTLADDYNVLWSTGDQIKFVKDGATSTTYTFTLSSGAGTTSGTFTCDESQTPEDGTYNVYYPASYDDTNWPAQTYVSATDISGAPMNATATVSDGKVSDLAFTNEGGILRYTVKGDQTIKSINVKSASPALDVTLDCGDGVALTEEGTVFNIALRAGEYSNATLTFSATDNTLAILKASTLKVTKNVVSLATFEASALSFVATTGTAKATINSIEVDVKWVQLWAGGPKFAEYNVGAENNNAKDYGGYYTWGGTYNNDSNLPGFSWTDDHNTGTDALSGDSDTATKLWGENWRMPTQTELQELIDNCDVVWTTIDGKDGHKFTGKGAYASNSVFLPAAGSCNDGDVSGQGDYGNYWSSTPNGSYYAYYLSFVSGGPDVTDDHRYYGFSVRAVLAK